MTDHIQWNGVEKYTEKLHHRISIFKLGDKLKNIR